MRDFLKFLRRLFFNFATLITGGILGLYYTLIAPSLETFQFKTALDFSIPFLGFLAACFLTWKNLYDENQQLQKRIARLEDDQPKYKLKVIDEVYILDDILSELAEERTQAEKKRSVAPKPNPWSIQIPSIMGGELMESDWTEYIDELDRFKTYIEEVKAIEGYRVINFELTNHGRADSNLNVTVRFENCEQIVDFYDDQILHKHPDRPSKNAWMSTPANVHPIERLGSRREIHEEKKDLLSVEYDIMRGGDEFHLHYNPIFVKPTSGEPMQVRYSFKSDKLIQTPEEVLIIS